MSIREPYWGPFLWSGAALSLIFCACFAVSSFLSLVFANEMIDLRWNVKAIIVLNFRGFAATLFLSVFFLILLWASGAELRHLKIRKG